ncbi:protein phosphatase 1H-like isoform X2 [Anneissia japonica]|uniref:protein phosphatase 1H-like isoform X2 n=1 Tax=Anneissia japonica TaxID=1529436 RepID=UPI0014257F00|nr:protein phosphatase 1H-like isoform X2 [Anneissia japonica]
MLLVINGGKTRCNEDQAIACHFKLKAKLMEHINPTTPEGIDVSSSEIEPIDISCSYFGVFDGHAGSGAALMARHLLHLHIQQHLWEIQELLQPQIQEDLNYLSRSDSKKRQKWPVSERDVPIDSLIIGALESSFYEMDEQIATEKCTYHISGGCTALVALFVLGKLYVANAGDSRAVICRGKEVIPMSSDHTPLSERQRLQTIAKLHPNLLGDEFARLEYQKRVGRKDIGKKRLYRDAHMTGWAYKTIEEDDLKFPLVYGDGKKARVLATIGVSRGLGDHDLKVHGTDIMVKPFLSSMPQVNIYDLGEHDHTENDVLILASDGLWDVLTIEDAGRIVSKSLESFSRNDHNRYTSAAQDLVMASRGILRENGWRTKSNALASGDDITAMVIPLYRHSVLSPQNSLTESHDAVNI